MKDAPLTPPEHAPLARPREAMSHFVEDVCRDLEAKKNRLEAAGSVDQLIEAATDTHKSLVDHGHTMGQFLKIVRNWQMDAN
ncbi:MAG TPA: hypothetical protein VJL86_01295 [Steroidobacteraceae bacterium]|jgi:hypothetical protein|nr:hypothetical protein [Steroidobacteraceae bacterium]